MLVTIENEVANQNKFPLIAKSKFSKTIVLFDSSVSGTILYNGGDYPVGYHSIAWTDVFEPGVWEILDEITTNFKSN